ncbi:uncharacterized protein G2W53_040637 [Senna tora]|uniref:Uncharacterized protein n=1 Tax=Senna tora TaxID=362788 RepID=A0A834SDP8_9FABA|nr:uncharacterized protein G2W53_040637 [Senna tora]
MAKNLGVTNTKSGTPMDIETSEEHHVGVERPQHPYGMPHSALAKMTSSDKS